MASPNTYLFDDESAAPTDRKPEQEELLPVERLGGPLASYLHHSSGYWPPLIYDWSDNALNSSNGLHLQQHQQQLQQQQQQQQREEAAHR